MHCVTCSASLHTQCNFAGGIAGRAIAASDMQRLWYPAQVWVLDALPGSMAEAAGPELRHRKDHPQDLIDRLQVSYSFPCVLHSHHWDLIPPSSDQAQALMSTT